MITSGLDTNFNLCPRYSFHKSLYKSFSLKPQLKFCPQFRTAKPEKNIICFGAFSYSASTQHGNLHPARWSILFCGLTQEAVLAIANTGKTRDRFEKNAGEWTGRVEISKEEIPDSKCSMHGNILTYPRL